MAIPWDQSISRGEYLPGVDGWSSRRRRIQHMSEPPEKVASRERALYGRETPISAERVVNRLVNARKDAPEGRFRHLLHIPVENVAHCNLQVAYYKDIVPLAINQIAK
jgi:hypothetical protein